MLLLGLVITSPTTLQQDMKVPTSNIVPSCLAIQRESAGHSNQVSWALSQGQLSKGRKDSKAYLVRTLNSVSLSKVRWQRWKESTEAWPTSG